MASKLVHAMAVVAMMGSLWLGLTSGFVAPRMQPLPRIVNPALAMTQQLDESKESAEDSKSHAQMPLVGLGLVLCAGAAMIGLRKGQAGGRPAAGSVVAVHAFENELGVQAPFGFWDPIGFTADGDVASFKRRRSVELKHSRICMLACMGYLTPEITGKLPGYLSPSAGLEFQDIPNGLGAISKVPALGWAQIVAYFGFVEIKGGFEDYKEGGTPGDYGWKLLTSEDPVEKTRKLQCELANGRLAMTAIMAMIFQNGVTGTTGPEMWGLRTNTGILAFQNELGVHVACDGARNVGIEDHQ